MSMPPTSLRSADSSAESPDPAQPPAKSTPGTSESEDHVGPTRASIRAWAEATPAGAPGDRASPGLRAMPRSNSDGNLSRASLTRSARVTPEGSVAPTSGGSRDASPQRSMEMEESLGNVADGESSSSDHASGTPPSSSPPPEDAALDARRELGAPHPHPTSPSHPPPPPIAQPQPHPPHAPRHVQFKQSHASPRAHATHLPRPPPYTQSSSDSIPSKPAHPEQPDQPERVERRHHHHHRNCPRHHHHHRRRHRDRDKDRDKDREHDHDKKRPSADFGAPGDDNNPNPRRDHDAHPPQAPRPGPVIYHLVPLRPLLPPPPPLPPLRALRVPSIEGDGSTTDILAEVVRMIKGTRAPLLRTGGVMDENYRYANADADGGWIPFPSVGAGGGSAQGPGRSPGSGSGGRRRENDVLDDIRRMIQWSRSG
ncbi:hypothetical protein C2E23DRAFT_237096 [Lenzites betulinus]|nr:hypothetical protein C2E23DRAFT_237096 [Lenzites betulinus]